MDYFKICYTVLGGLGVFFFGMKNMSDSLQAMGGEMIKKVISTLTSNRFLAVGVGTFVTMLIQSSSITTVMLVGFVNAGLMNLTQAMGVIFGANIGTTITGWIISIKVSKYGLLLVGVGVFPYLFASKDKIKNIGQLVFALGFIFFGLTIMSSAFKPLRTDPAFINHMTLFTAPTYTSYLASAGIGCLLTMIIQSSSAMLGITIAMATTGIIPFQTAAALVLGENIGTTITAQLASIGGNINARRTARGHACFNLLGVILVLSIFPYYLDFIERLVPGAADFMTADGNRPNIAVHIATSHTVFNLIATISFLPFLTPLVKFVEFIVPDRAKEITEKDTRLKFIGESQHQIPDVSLLEVKNYILRLKATLDHMFRSVNTYLFTDSTQTAQKFQDDIFQQEDLTDEYTTEINIFVGQIIKTDLTKNQSAVAQAYLSIADELESIGDYIKKLAISGALYKENHYFDENIKEDLSALIKEAMDFYDDSMQIFEDNSSIDFAKMKERSKAILEKADQLRQNHVTIIMEKKVDPSGMLDYSDIVNTVRRIRSHTFGICKALKDVKYFK